MISKEQRIIIIRGKFIYNKSVETQNIMVVEYSGIATLLSEEPSIFMTIRKVSVDSVEDLFNDKIIADKYTDHRSSNSSYGKFTVDDGGRLKIDNSFIRDIIFYRNGLTYDYMYLEIYVTN